MTTRLNDHEGPMQNRFVEHSKDSTQLDMDRLQSRRQDAQIKYPGTQGLREDKSAVIPIASHEDSTFGMRV